MLDYKAGRWWGWITGTLTNSRVNKAPRCHQASLCSPPFPFHPSLVPTLLPGIPWKKDVPQPYKEP